MRILTASAVALALVAASAAQAQTAAPPEAAKPAPGSTVSGVTVEAPKLPTKECSAKDKACIALVVAELRAHYPHELQRFCDYRAWRDIQAGNPVFGVETSGGSSLRIACAKEQPKDKDE